MTNQPSIDEIAKLEEFVRTKCQATDQPICIFALAKEFIETTGSTTLTTTMGRRITRYGDKVMKTPGIDLSFKAKVLFALGVTINKNLMNELKQNGEVSFDDRNRITKYVASDGSLTLEGTHSQYVRKKDVVGTNGNTENNGVNCTQDAKNPEFTALLNFVLAECRTSDKPLYIRKTIQEFIEMTKSTTKNISLRNRLATFCKNVFDNSDFDLNTKVMFIYGLCVYVTPETLEKLLQNAEVILNKRNRIIKYVAINGSLTLGKYLCGAKTAEARDQSASAVEMNNQDLNVQQPDSVPDQIGNFNGPFSISRLLDLENVGKEKEKLPKHVPAMNPFMWFPQVLPQMTATFPQIPSMIPQSLHLSPQILTQINQLSHHLHHVETLSKKAPIRTPSPQRMESSQFPPPEPSAKRLKVAEK